MADLKLLGHVLMNDVHRHMARAFDHHLNVVLPGDLGELAKSFQLAELGFVIGIGNRPGRSPSPSEKDTS